MGRIQKKWGELEYWLATPGVISKVYYIRQDQVVEQTYDSHKEGAWLVLNGRVIVTAEGTKQTWNTFQILNKGDSYGINSHAKYKFNTVEPTVILEVKIPDIGTLIHKILNDAQQLTDSDLEE